MVRGTTTVRPDFFTGTGRGAENVMRDLVIKPVETRRERQQFLELPWNLYRHDSLWIPPLRQNQRELVGYRRHPFYDDADVQTFLAFVDGVPCGRIAAIDNRAHCRKYNDGVGFVGFFESIDDAAVADGLFQASWMWLSQRGLQIMRGPANPSLNYECGLLVEGFHSSPTFMMTYNPPYYARLWEQFGFAKVQDMFAFRGDTSMLSQLNKKLAFIVEESVRRFKLRIRPLSRSRFLADVAMFLDIYNKSLEGTWGFVPLSPSEAAHSGRALRHLLVPELTVIGEAEGREVGAVFGMLDYNPRIKRMDGRLFPLGFLQLWTNRRAIHRVRLISTNVLPEFQKWGLGLAMMGKMLPKAIAFGVTEAEFSWVLESNHLSRSTLEKGGAVRDKTYRMYDYSGTLEPRFKVS